MEILEGYLFSKLAAIGSKSEGPQYFLQQFNYDELSIIKQAVPWQEDRNLHPHLNKKVKIEGTITPNGIEYTSIRS
jgi:hypothetical protein